MKRTIDLILASILLLILIIPMMIIALAIRLTSEGPALFYSTRVGINGKAFQMPKFRSMKIDTPNKATHLLEQPNSYLTPIGSFLRSSSLDELPQLFTIMKGDMSFVGPRPALFNQKDLIKLRAEKGVDSLLPGITGWAQVNGRDELSISQKVTLDLEYLNKKSFWFDNKILWLTIIKVLFRENISH